MPLTVGLYGKEIRVTDRNKGDNQLTLKGKITIDSLGWSKGITRALLKDRGRGIKVSERFKDPTLLVLKMEKGDTSQRTRVSSRS